LRLLITLIITIVMSTPLSAQTVAQLQLELEAQKQINALQKQRIRSLESRIAAARQSPAVRTKPTANVVPVSVPTRPDPGEDRALERALVRRGSAVLAPGVLEVTPSLSWAYSGRPVLNSTDQNSIAGLDVRMGLQNGWMLGARTSLRHRDIDGLGNNSGMGDTSVTVWKNIDTPVSAPSLVASLNYSTPTGENFSQNLVPLGSGFHELTGRLSAVKTFAPIAFFGDVAYSYRLPEDFKGVEIERASGYGLGFGASLAVTPAVSASVALRYLFEDDFKRNGVTLPGTSSTNGSVNLGFGVVLSKNVFLNLNAAFGVTDDAPDTVVSFSIPLRF
jgi:opacity protein-like surface antigen